MARSLKSVSAVFLAFCWSVSAALAHGSLGPATETDLRAMAEKANLIVVATVADVQYKNVPVKGEQQTLPVGLVSLKVSQTLRGKAPKGPLVVRFLGGPDGQGGIYRIGGVPLFQPGETNILFIEGNGDQTCPLTNCEWGRFRLLNGAVYSTHGSPVVEVAKGHAIARGAPPKELTLFRFPAPTFDAVMQNPVIKEAFSEMGMTYEEGKARYEREAPKFIEYRAQVSTVLETAEAINDPLPAELEQALKLKDPRKTEKLKTSPMASKLFLAEIAKIAKAAKRAPKPVQPVNPSADYVLPAFTKAGPPADVAKAGAQIDPQALKEAEDPLGAVQQAPDNKLQKPNN